MRASHLKSSVVRHREYSYAGNIVAHPSLGHLQVLEDTKKNRILGYRVNIDRFGLKDSGLLKINERLSHENLLCIDGINSINHNKEHFIFLEHFSTTLEEEIKNRSLTHSTFSEAEIISLLNDIGGVLAYLQANKISHIKVKGDSIVKVGSRYKLLDTSPFLKYKPASPESDSDISLVKSPPMMGKFGSSANGRTSSQAQESHKNNISRLGFLVLDAMNLSSTNVISTESKVTTAACFYSQNVMQLVRKMMEVNSPSRLDCSTCFVYIKEMYKQFSLNDSLMKSKNESRVLIETPVNLPPPSSSSIRERGFIHEKPSILRSDNFRYVESATIPEVQEDVTPKYKDFDIPISKAFKSPTQKMKIDIPDLVHLQKDKDIEPVRPDEFKVRPAPAGSVQQDSARLKSPDSARNPFNEINDLIREHHSPPDTMMRDFSTDYLTSTASPQKTNFTSSVPTSTRALNKPTPPVSELKAIQEIRPEETQNFSNVTAHNETQKEVKEHIKEYNKPSPVPPIQHMKKVQEQQFQEVPPVKEINKDKGLPTFGEDEMKIKPTQPQPHSQQQQPQLSNRSLGGKPPLPSARTEKDEVAISAPLDISIRAGERSPTMKQPTHITDVYPDGSVYKGEVFGKMKHGIGTLIYPDGSYYGGEWKNDLMEGYGVLFYANGKIAYEGEWQNNKCNGRGVMYNEKALAFTGFANQRASKAVETIWHRYEGGFCNDKWEGEGKLIFTNGDEFCGDFVNDLIHGNGKYVYKSGDFYEGEWVNNVLVRTFD